jgi:DNA-binding GntR family transcriptional regulator
MRKTKVEGMTIIPGIARLERDSERRQLPDEVASYVRELIMSGAVRPGDFLRMERIAEALGISNTPVREGLLALTSEGFVQQVPRRGFTVAPFSPQDIRDLFLAQGWLAGELASRAAKKITPQTLARLDEIVKANEAAHAANDKERVADLGHAFHREINLAADSIRLATLLGSVVRQLPSRFYVTIEGAADASIEEHPTIVDALRKGDSRKVRKLMEKHISEGADYLVETLEKRGMWSETKTS